MLQYGNFTYIDYWLFLKDSETIQLAFSAENNLKLIYKGLD